MQQWFDWVSRIGESLGPTANVLQVITAAIELTVVAGALIASVKWFFEYRRNVFRNMMSCTLNVVEMRNGKDRLVLRGLYQGTVRGFFGERPTLRAFMRGISHTTTTNPFIMVNDKKLRERVLEAFVMTLSTRPGIEAKVAKFLGIYDGGKVQLIGIPTFERFNDDRDHKVRPWYIEANQLSRFLDGTWVTTLEFEHAHHKDRVVWLRALAEICFNGTTARIPESEVRRVKAMIHKVVV